MQESHELDEATVEVLADLNSQIRALNVAREAILMRFTRANKLNPQDWQLSDDQKNLVHRNGVQQQFEQRES